MDKSVQTALDLIRIKSLASNPAEIKKAAEYCKNYFKGMEGVHIATYGEGEISPVLVIANAKTDHYDALALGHLDVVPESEPGQFDPAVKDGKLYGRGSLDMKAWVAVLMNVLEELVLEKSPVKMAVILTTDEETTGQGAKYLTEKTPITGRVLLDVDVASSIKTMIQRTKNATFVELSAEGVTAHGSMPWLGLDANEQLMKTIANIRKHFPHYDNTKEKPADEWVNTMHVGTIEGGSASNVISGSAKAALDFRLTEGTTTQDLIKILHNCLEKGVSFKIGVEGILVTNDPEAPLFKAYRKTVEKIIGIPVGLYSIGGTTDARYFAKKNIPVIMHSGAGEGLHGKGEYCTVESMEQMKKIQLEFLRNLPNI